MTIQNVDILFAFAPQTQPGQEPPPMWTSLVPLLLIGVVFYFILLRPQQKRAKQQAEMLKSIKRGDRVATSAGIVGLVETVKDRTVIIKSEGSKLEILKSAVADITERGGDSGAS
jgi:preprotein translocase subunit YajC